MFDSLGTFWKGFILGAALFGCMGTIVGIWIVALCQAAADRGRCLSNNRESQPREMRGFEPIGYITADTTGKRIGAA